MHNGHFAKFNLFVFFKLITDNVHHKGNQFKNYYYYTRGKLSLLTLKLLLYTGNVVTDTNLLTSTSTNKYIKIKVQQNK